MSQLPFRNPWGGHPSHQRAPSLSSQHRPSFSQALPTTYEVDGMNPEHYMQPPQQQHAPFLPPLRAAAPGPIPYPSQGDYLKEVQRRQSVAVSGGNYLPPPPFDYMPNPIRRRPTPRAKPVRSYADLNPRINKTPRYRRASSANLTLSPLLALTVSLPATYGICRPDFNYKSSKNPRRVLTKPSKPKTNNGLDNSESDYILYVNDVLGGEESKKYMVLDILGHGTFGQVAKCQNLTNQEIVAIKVVKSKPAYLNQSLTEITILEHLNTKVDPNDCHHFLRLKDKFMHKNHLCLVFELLSSNIYELIKQNQFHGLSIRLVRVFTKQLLDSLAVLKDANLIHCDLKPENILLVSPDRPDLKIIDFGSACHERQTMYTYIQSRFYRSPEVMLGLAYTSSIDMWSLGCIVAEVFLGLPLFPGTSEYNQLYRIIDMLGLPPHWMMEIGKNTSTFMNRQEVGGRILYSMKSIEQFNAQNQAHEEPGKQYFQYRKLEDIVMNYQFAKKNMTKLMMDRELKERESLVHFLRGMLNINPLERWTPQQALMHPFITGQDFDGNWTPFGNKSVEPKDDQFFKQRFTMAS